jgi:hypothetical protein
VTQATEIDRQIAEDLRGEWRMIASVSLRPAAEGDGYEAVLRLDPVVLKGSLEQQGYPRSPAAATRLEARRLEALGECVRRVNGRLPAKDRIRGFSVVA